MNDTNDASPPSVPAENADASAPKSDKSRAYIPMAIVSAVGGLLLLVLAIILGYAGIDVQTPTGLESLASLFVGLLVLASIVAFGIAIFLLVLSKRR